MLRAGDHDDRVVPLHTHKLLATLQHALCFEADSPQRNPIISRCNPLTRSQAVLRISQNRPSLASSRPAFHGRSGAACTQSACARALDFGLLGLQSWLTCHCLQD